MVSSKDEGGSPPRRQLIPLRHLESSPDHDEPQASSLQHLRSSNVPSHTPQRETPHGLMTSTYWDQPYDQPPNDVVNPINTTRPLAGIPHDDQEPVSWTPTPTSTGEDPLSTARLYVEEHPHQDYLESDRVPLTTRVQPISGSLSVNNFESQPRDSFQTVSDFDTDPTIPRDSLHPTRDVELGNGSSRRPSYGMLNTNELHSSRPSSTSEALLYAGSIVRAVSQRVVNISGDTEVASQRASRHRSRSPQDTQRSHSRNPTLSEHYDTSYPSQTQNLTAEKERDQEVSAAELPRLPRQHERRVNPLKGRTLGIFGSDSRIRMRLCNILVNPYTEPTILLLIVFQAILLTVESAPNVFTPGNGRPERWGRRWIDWAMFALFIVFTCELLAKIIVSGFILNAAEYSTIDRKKGIRAAIENQYRAVFQPQRHKSVKASLQFPPEPSAIARSFTTFVQGQQALPKTLEDQLRFKLARRAFLRHSFNRLDFVAVVAYWIALILGVSGLESQHHIYVFKMLSCLRILRLLAVTHGTAVRYFKIFNWIQETISNMNSDHSPKFEEGGAATSASCLPDWLLLAIVRHPWCSKFQV